MTENNIKLILLTLKASYQTFSHVLGAIRSHPAWEKNKAACENAISEYRKKHPLKVGRGMAFVELMSAAQDEEKAIMLLACMTDDDWKELENMDLKVEKNE